MAWISIDAAICTRINWVTIKAKQLSYNPKRLPLTRFEWIVIHYTANDGGGAEAHGRYFAKTNELYAGAHVFTDSKCAVKSVPLSYAAYAVGGAPFLDAKKTGGAVFYGECTNENSISVEMCDDSQDGLQNVTTATLERTIAVTKYYMNKYKIDADHVIRHFDVNGKHCPAYMSGEDNAYWEYFKARISE